MRYICCKCIFSSHKMCLEMEFSSQFSQTKHALFWYIQEFVLVSSIKISYILFSQKNLLYTKSCIIYTKKIRRILYIPYIRYMKTVILKRGAQYVRAYILIYAGVIFLKTTWFVVKWKVQLEYIFLDVWFAL